MVFDSAQTDFIGSARNDGFFLFAQLGEIFME